MAGAIVGDILHNLRSALDHVAWLLVLLDGGQRPMRPTRSQPICDKSAVYLVGRVGIEPTTRGL